MPTSSRSLSVRKSTENSGQGETVLRTALGSSDFFLPVFHYLTIPKNTAIASYTSYTLRLPVSQTQRVWVEFPKGCAGLVGFSLWRGVSQIFPLPAGAWLRSNDLTPNFAFTHLIDAEPYEVELRGYNLDDTYGHTLWIALELRGLPETVTPRMQELINFVRSG